MVRLLGSADWLSITSADTLEMPQICVGGNTAAEDDRLIGGLWANMSEGRCRFVMVKDKRWEGIEEHLR